MHGETVTASSFWLYTFGRACMENVVRACVTGDGGDLRLGALVLEPVLHLPALQANLCAERAACRRIWVVTPLVCTAQHSTAQDTVDVSVVLKHFFKKNPE
jgi:hypothetical protein